MIKDNLTKLRNLMKDNKIDVYIIPTSDFHGSEYVGNYFKCREFISGFTGSAGTVLVTADKALLWTDGRYFLQAGAQLKNTGIELMKMGEEDVPTIEEYLAATLLDNQCVGFDGRTVKTSFVEMLLDDVSDKNISINYNIDLVGEIWKDRPDISKEPVICLDIKYAGETRESKISKVQSNMRKKGVQYYILTSLDDIAWLLNIRGNDVECNPVVLSYAVIKDNEILLFANEEAFSKDLRNELSKADVIIKPYNLIYEYIKNIESKAAVLIDGKVTNYSIMSNIPDDVRVVDETNITFNLKAVKNNIEVDNIAAAHIKDGIAVTKFMYWLKKNVGKVSMTELSLSEVLENYRKEQLNYIGPSFNPIVSYKHHGAIVHYSATKETDITVEADNFLLVDTGGQYLEGTTDITRTFALGNIDDEQKKYFTAVLCGNLELASAKFLYGCRGVNLDYLARRPLWDIGVDYNHGTGHGVGYFLNVHEGPNSFRWRLSPESAVFEEGMITSNEPGFYLAGKYGIRCENLMVCRKAEKNEYGQFMCFETLTLAPFDIEAIDTKYMDTRDIKLLNDYHKKVYDTISPYLSIQEKEWLKEATRQIKS